MMYFNSKYYLLIVACFFSLASLHAQNIKFVQASAGLQNSLLLDDEGQVYAFGRNNYGQLGIGNNIAQNIPVKIDINSKIVQIVAGYEHSLLLDDEGQVYAFGKNDV